MRFSCESCGAQYMISDEKVGPGGVRVRCKKCGNVIPVRRAGGDAADAGAAGAAAGAVAALRSEPDLDRDLEQAFQNVLGGGSIASGAPGDVSGGSTAEPNAVAPAEIAAEWYVAIDDRQVGPMPPSGVRSRWETGDIGPDTLAWHAGMSDWAPLASIPEMTRFLASASVAARPSPVADPKAHAGAEPSAGAAAATSAAAAVSPATGGKASGHANGHVNGHANGHAGGWQPSAAAALATLAARDLTPDKPAALAGAPAASSGSSLLDRMDLPEGGVDPTHLLPLPMKGVETTEVDLKPKATVQPERTEIRQLRKQAKRSGAAMGVAVATVVAAAIGVALWMFRPVPEEHPAPVVAAVPAPPGPATSPPAAAVPAAPAPAPEQAPPAGQTPIASAAAAAAPPAAATTAAQAAPAATQQPSPSAVGVAPPVATPEKPAALTQGPAVETPRAPPPTVAETAPAPHPVRVEAAPPKKKITRRERLALAAASQPAPRVATAAPIRRPPEPGQAAPAPSAAPPTAVAEAPRKKGGDPLLDVGGDDDLEKELSSTKPKRSVYVPPAIGSDVPENVSVSQINEAVVGQKAALLRCIEQQRAADSSARGTLKLRWIITGDGSTRDVRVLSDEFSKQPIGSCISGVVKGIRFPRSRTSGQEVVFPFKF